MFLVTGELLIPCSAEEPHVKKREMHPTLGLPRWRRPPTYLGREATLS